MKRKPPAPDLLPKWSDPDLPCIRVYRYQDGRVLTEVDADYEHKYAQHRMTSPAPEWHDDPTYNLRRKKL